MNMHKKASSVRESAHHENSLPAITSSNFGRTSSNFRLVDPYRETGKSGFVFGMRESGNPHLKPAEHTLESSKQLSFGSRKKAEIFLKTGSEASFKVTKTDGLYYDSVIKKLMTSKDSYEAALDKAKKLIKRVLGDDWGKEVSLSTKAVVHCISDIQQKLTAGAPLNTGLCIRAIETLIDQVSSLSNGAFQINDIKEEAENKQARKEKLREQRDNFAADVQVRLLHPVRPHHYSS